MIADIRAISFDCYGTLVDWQTGIRCALVGILQADDADLFKRYAALERRAEQPPYRSYKEVLEDVATGLGARMGTAEAAVLWKSLGGWPAFDETPGVLAGLKRRYRLAVVSNVDDDLFAGSAPKLGVELDVLVTAEQVRSYKPGLAHFHELQRRLQLPARQVLHVAESRFHDIEPANAMGMPTVWVDRARGRASASGEGGGEPTMIVHSLAELARELGG